jgi:hypothetical protein
MHMVGGAGGQGSLGEVKGGAIGGVYARKGLMCLRFYRFRCLLGEE